MGFRYDHDSGDPLAPRPPSPPPGVRMCGPRPPTAGDLAVVTWFAAWVRDPGRVPFPGCARCERVTSLDLEPGQVASCGEHSYVRRGEPR